MRFCEECGAKLDDDAKFCEECGAQVELIEIVSTKSFEIKENEVGNEKETVNKETVNQDSVSAKNKVNKKAIIIAASVGGTLLLIAIAAMVIFFVYNNINKILPKQEATTVVEDTNEENIVEDKTEETTVANTSNNSTVHNSTTHTVIGNGNTSNSSYDDDDYDDDYDNDDDVMTWEDAPTYINFSAGLENPNVWRIGESYYSNGVCNDVFFWDAGEYYNPELNEYWVPYSSTVLYTEDAFEVFNKATLRVMRNEIYARHGRMFDSEDLDSYFRSLPWYNPRYTPDEFKESFLNDIEKKNIKTISKVENSK